jgi:hypothetical protein
VLWCDATFAGRWRRHRPERLSASHDKPLPNYRGRGRGSGHAPSAWAAESGTVSTDQALQNIVLGLQVSLNL